MSRLAGQLPHPDTIATRTRKGPTGACDIYGQGDLEDWAAVETMRLAHDWATAHTHVDAALDIPKRIDGNAFRYHWRRKCWHWTEDQRNTTLNEVQG